jgi:hypothetical protein
MKLDEVAQFATAAIPIVAVIWQIAEMKSAIYKYVDSNSNNQNFRTLVFGAFGLAIADPNFRTSFADLAKVGIGGYLGQMMPQKE